MVRFFFSIYQTFASKKLLAFGIMAVLFLSLGWLASKIQFEEDITKLIPANDETKQAQKVLQHVNFADKIIINISREDNGSVSDLTQYTSEYIDSINKNASAYIEHIQGRVGNEDIFETTDFAYENLPILLDEEDYDIIANKIDSDSVAAITQQNYKTLISPSGVIAKEMILKDPLSLSFLALNKLRKLSFGEDFVLKDGFLVTKDEKHILLFIAPAFSTSETEQNAKLIAHLDQTHQKLNKKYKGKVSGEYFGATPVAVANAKQIKNDIQFTVGIAITILLIAFMFFYRKLLIPLILFTPTVFGALLAIVFLYMTRGTISAISLGIGSILLGVTLDYSLHILTHIRNGNNPKKLYKEITWPVLMSSLTTALAFLCLLFLRSQALQDLGIFAAVSVLGASVFALLFIPQVYKKRVKKRVKNTSIDAIAAYPFHKNKWIFMGVGALILIGLFTYNKVRFNNDLSTLNYEPESLKAAEKRLNELTNISAKSIYLVAYADNEEAALEVNDSIYNKLQGLKEASEIIDYSSIGALIPSEKEQERKIGLWNSFWDEQTKRSLKENLINSSEELGFKENTFSAFYSLLNKDFYPVKSDEFSKLSTFLIEDYISVGGDFVTVSTVVQVNNNNLEQVKNAFAESPGVLIVDRKEMNETLLGNLKTDFNSLIKYSLLVVLLILFIFFRSFSLTFVTVMPIVLTWVLTIGVMGLLGIEFNIFNIIISTFIFGLGVDYSIFITNGLLTEYRTGGKALPTFKTSIILSVITTVLGVGVLIFAKHPALYSISVVCIIGIFSAMLLSFTIQPVLFKYFIGDNKNEPMPLRPFFHSVFSFGYFGLGGFLLSVLSITVIKILPISKKLKMSWFHKTVSKVMKSVLYTNGFVKKEVINPNNETFSKQSIIIANHTSFLDILAIGMLYPKMIFLVNDWVYNSPVFGKAVQLAGFYPVSDGIENGLSHLQKKVDQGYTLMAFPEGTRSASNKIKRFHKGAFFLAEKFKLDIIPVLIHGNSEVLPKGSFVIKDGNISLKILDRIAADDNRFGETYSKRAKQIGRYFREKFRNFRNEKETSTYFHRLIKEAYRYKGRDVYKEVKYDIEKNKETYFKIIRTIGEKDVIVHWSRGHGQLDYLISLDAINRKIITYLNCETSQNILRNSYMTQGDHKIEVVDSIAETENYKADVLLIDYDVDEAYSEAIFSKVSTVVLCGTARSISGVVERQGSFNKTHQSEEIIIFKKD
ncbi:1-acyl-sn-glycerol-3-phosphate acyltransferase [Galbibacter sp. EGI 63066]|uniref:1-acyl-sn-glycerol-3-phosphate acyltransferase n=1 Tax=Galbibacter sp. EGI 63066 TaxID=2993559 RepID=UPI0022497A2B|nr:1-acyl-sn-glycerol-3-phosphate acyltransferase [Galbibacter sp. EGI 63066]MCX2678351.1 1-acyl-sn-glycerol-3-phosphate acyltransferase [Galbibacter sp. EGI 63066]